MRLWLKARGTRSIAVCIGVAAVGVAVARDVAVPLPNLVGGAFVPVPLVFVPPLVVALVLARNLPGSDLTIELVSTRHLTLRDAVYVLAVCSVLVVLASVGALLSGQELIGAGRDSIGYIGLMLIGRVVLGSGAAAALPSTYVVLASLIRSATGWSQVWGWAFAPHDSVLSWACAVLLMLIGSLIGTRARV